MSIANEIQRLKTAKADIKAAIEQKGVVVGDGTIDTYAEKISEISGGGTDIDRCLKSGRFPNLNVFGKTEVVLNLDSWESSFQNLFQITNEQNRNVICEHITINCPYTIESINQIFYCQYPYTDETLKRLTLNISTTKCKNYLNAFTQMRALEVIDGTPLDFSNVISASNTNAFPNTVSLKEVRFVPNSIKVSIMFANSSQLSTDTIQSIIDGLADLSGEEQYVIAGSKNGPDTFAYPEQEITIPMDEIHNVRVWNGYTMDDGAPLYMVTHGSAWAEDYAYKKVMGGGTTQTLTLHKTVGNKLTDAQKATITAKNWTLVY